MSLTASITSPFPTQRPWSGGSRLSWLPPSAFRRWLRKLRPLKLVTSSEPGVVTLSGAGLGANPGATCGLGFPGIGRFAADAPDAELGTISVGSGPDDCPAIATVAARATSSTTTLSTAGLAPLRRKILDTPSLLASTVTVTGPQSPKGAARTE